tara:strand:+ start:594 stop:1124 length:531 start_codon:yes stop_codon:yes gene_type:complete
MKLELMSNKNLKEIFEFEIDNRNFFEQILPPRPQAYFEFSSFENLMQDILKEQDAGECAMFIIRNNEEKMIGRINFSTIKKRNDDIVAEIGYRLAEAEQGKGHATKALALAIERGYQTYGINLVEAGTSTENIGSQKVLEKNGFIRVGQEKKVMQVNGKWLDGVLYAKKISGEGHA